MIFPTPWCVPGTGPTDKDPQRPATSAPERGPIAALLVFPFPLFLGFACFTPSSHTIATTTIMQSVELGSSDSHHAAPQRATFGTDARPPDWKPQGLGGDADIGVNRGGGGGGGGSGRSGYGWGVKVELPSSSASSSGASTDHRTNDTGPGSSLPRSPFAGGASSSAMPVDDPVAVKSLTSQVRHDISLSRRRGVSRFTACAFLFSWGGGTNAA